MKILLFRILLWAAEISVWIFWRKVQQYHAELMSNGKLFELSNNYGFISWC